MGRIMHWNGTIDLGNVLTLIGFLGLAFAGWQKIGNRLGAVEDNQQTQHTLIQAQATIASKQYDILNETRIVATRLETLIEGQDKRIARLEDHS